MKKPIIAASALIIPFFVATAQDTDKSKWKDVGIEFPKTMFVGTRVAAKLPNLDPSKKPRLVTDKSKLKNHSFSDIPNKAVSFFVCKWHIMRMRVFK